MVEMADNGSRKGEGGRFDKMFPSGVLILWSFSLTFCSTIAVSSTNPA